MKPSPDSDRLFVAHILRCIERIGDYTKADRATFFGSVMVQDAVVRNLQTRSESTQRISEPLKASEPEVPWSAIAGFRNVLTHNYLAIDLEAVWSVVERDLPGLGAAIERMSRKARGTGDDS